MTSQQTPSLRERIIDALYDVFERPSTSPEQLADEILAAISEQQAASALIEAQETIDQLTSDIETLRQNYAKNFERSFVSGVEAGKFMLAARDAQPDHSALLRRASKQLMAWAEKYGQHDPQWLPPAGDVRLLEDINAALTAQPAQGRPASAELEACRKDAERYRFLRDGLPTADVIWLGDGPQGRGLTTFGIKITDEDVDNAAAISASKESHGA